METTYCDKCGKAIPTGATAMAITAGSIEEDAGGFTPDSDPYIKILCDDCAEGISMAVDLMPVTPAHEQAGDLLATLEYCANVLTAAGGPTPAEREQAAARARQLVGQIRTEEKAIEAGKGTREPAARYGYQVGQIIHPFGPETDGNKVLDRRTFHGVRQYVIDGVDNCDKLGRWRPYWWREDELSTPGTTREPGAGYSTPEPSAEPTVRAVLVVTGNGGGLLNVVPADVPRQVWEDGEAREWAEALALPGPLDSGEGYEIMTAEDARDMAAKLIEAAGKPPPTKGPVIWDGAEGSCPLCGADLDMGAEESTSDGEGIATANWTCPKCHAAGVQVREAVFQYHRNVEAAPNDPRTVNFTDKAGKPGYYVAGALGEGGGPVLTTPEAARLLRTHGYNLPFDIMARNYGMDNREEGDEDYIGLSPEDLEEGSLDPDWGPFEVW